MATIGTDISIQTCKDEGYTLMDYDGRKKFSRTEYYRIYSYYPLYVRKDLGFSGKEVPIMTEQFYSFDELEEMYLVDKEAINKFCETHNYVNFVNPTHHDMLSLATDLASYGSIP